MIHNLLWLNGTESICSLVSTFSSCFTISIDIFTNVEDQPSPLHHRGSFWVSCKNGCKGGIPHTFVDLLWFIVSLKVQFVAVSHCHWQFFRSADAVTKLVSPFFGQHPNCAKMVSCENTKLQDWNSLLLINYVCWNAIVSHCRVCPLWQNYQHHYLIQLGNTPHCAKLGP